MRIPDTTAVSGNTIDIPIYADSSLTGKGVISYLLQLTYNQSYFQATSVIVAGTISSSFGNPTVNTSVPGKITISGYGTTALTGSGKFIYIRFTALQSSSFYLSFTGASNNYFNEGTPIMSFKNAYITISSAPTITISPDVGTITKGEQIQFSVSGGTDPYQWSLTNPTVATISTSGLLTGIQPGFTKVVVQSSNGIVDTTNLVEIRAMRLTIPSNLNQWQGADILVPITTTDMSGLNIVSGNISISFNQNILFPVGIDQTGTLLASYPTPTYNVNNSGNFSMVFYGSTALTGSGTIIYIRFHVSTQNTGSSSISFISGLFNENLLPTFTNGYFSSINLPTLTISPNTGSLSAAETLQLTVNGGGLAPFTWSVNDTSIGSVTQTGLITAKRSGILNVNVHDSVGANATSGNFQIYDTRIIMPDTTICPSSSIFYYPIQIKSLPLGESVISFQGTVTYNASYLTFMDIETNGTLSQGWTYMKNPSSGQLIFAGYGTSSFNTAGTIIKLKFTLNQSFVTGTNAYINLNNVMLNEGFPLPLVDNNGYILGTNPVPSALNANNLTAHSANLSWTSATLTPWDIEYGLSGFTQGSGIVIIGTTQNPYPLMGLTASTSYQFYVKATCGSTWVGPYSFSTLCDNISIFPLNESFDGTSFVPNCWTVTQVAGTGNWTRSTSGVNPTCSPNSGAGMAYFNSYSFPSTTKSALISPPLNLSSDGYRVSFWMYRDNAYSTNADLVNVYYNTFNSISGATLLGTINRSISLSPVVSSNGWYQYFYNLPAGSAGNSRHIIFEALSAVGNNIYIDDINIKLPLAHDASSVSIDINDVVSQGNVTPKATVKNVGANTENFNVTLTIGSSYTSTKSVASLAPGASQQITFDSWNATIGVFTANVCTSLISDTTASNNCISKSIQVALVYCTPTYTNGGSTDFISQVKLGTLNQTTVSNASPYFINYTATQNAIPNLQAGFNYNLILTFSSDASQYNGVWLDFNQNGTFETTEFFSSNTNAGASGTATIIISVPLTSNLGNIRMRIRGGDDSQPSSSQACGASNSNYGQAQDYLVNILAPPSCMFPSSLTAYNITSQSADLGWTAGGSESSWAVEWGLSGFVQGTGTMISTATNPQHISGLTSSTTYAYYVRAICSSSNSDWIGPYSFTSANVCLTPTALTANNITANSAKLSWVNPTATSWIIEFGPTGFTHGNGATISGILQNPFLLTGLSASITYQYYVKSDCGNNGTSSWAGPFAFTTLCGNINAFPFNESFNGTTFIPNCWTLTQVSGTGNWNRSTSGTYPTCSPHSGAGMAYFNSFNFAAGTKSDIISPPLNLSTDGFKVSFWMYRDNAYLTYSDQVNVYYNTTSSVVGATLLGTVNRSISLSPVVASSAWYQYFYNLPVGSAGNSRYVILEAVSAYGNNIFIDDINIALAHDVSTTSIDLNEAFAQGSVIPKATFKNEGPNTETFNVSLTIGSSYSSTKTISSIASGSYQQVSFDSWNSTAGVYSINACTSLSGDANSSNNCKSKSIHVLNLNKQAYAYIANSGSCGLPKGPCKFNLVSAGIINSVANQNSLQNIEGATWANGLWYGVSGNTAGNNTLLTIDPISGARNVIGLTGVKLTGLSFNRANNKLYGVDATNLYIVNMLTGVSTLVGTNSGLDLQSLAINNAGDAYALDNNNDVIGRINLTTGAFTTIGSVGFYANYSSDLEFDRESGELYMLAHNDTTGNSGNSWGWLAWVNQLTGNTVSLGNFPGGSQLIGFAIPYSTIFNLSGGGQYCIGSVPITLNLSGSETYYSYQLKRSGINYGTAVNGTGSILSWNITEAGTYTCESNTANMIGSPIVTVVSTAAPIGSATQSFNFAATIADLIASGNAIKWYNTLTGGNVLLPTDILIDGNTYFASQTIGGCESQSRLGVTVSVNLIKTISLHVILEGLFNYETNLMNEAQDIDWESGLTYSKYGHDIADRIQVDLYDESPPYDPIGISISGIDLSTAGWASFQIDAAHNESYYIRVSSRNHLELWSANTIPFNNPLIIYDFTTSAQNAYQAPGGNDPQIQITLGVFACFLGDLDQSMSVDFDDFNIFEPYMNDGVYGFTIADFNGNGLVDFDDFNLFEPRLNEGPFAQYPGMP